MDREKVWLITGCSSGMGREIALEALERGYRVMTSARRPETLDSIVDRYPDRARAVELDVTRPEQVEAARDRTLEEFGSIDVLVNNAGYGYVAAIEEGEEPEVRAMFETNFFGLMSMTRAVIPLMRERRQGQIINNSSQAGLMSRPGTGYYSTTKYAVEAFTEALSFELAPFDVKVSGVQAGPFRTEWAGRSMKRTRHSNPAYADTVHARARIIEGSDGQQPGDPARAAKVIVDLAEVERPPLQLLLGKMVLDAYREKLEGVVRSLDEWEETTISCDFPDAEPLPTPTPTPTPTPDAD